MAPRDLVLLGCGWWRFLEIEEVQTSLRPIRAQLTLSGALGGNEVQKQPVHTVF